MTDHLPECEYEEGPGYTKGVCVCSELRACEARKDAEYAALREVAESLSAGNDVDELVRLAKEADRLHFLTGVAAARGAVEASITRNGWEPITPFGHGIVEGHRDALRAIDAVPGEPYGGKHAEERRKRLERGEQA